ncbi:MAG: hypothetical protein Q8K75_03045 [Chlamydiales bacterium]|nr:hypothetical protein [Chlamydiales bacterium]
MKKTTFWRNLAISITTTFLAVISTAQAQPIAGIQALGMGGASVAHGLDSISAFYNPATAAQIGCRVDFGVTSRFTNQSLRIGDRPATPVNTQLGNFSNIKLWDFYGEGGYNSHWEWNGHWVLGVQWNNYDHIHTHYHEQITDFSGFVGTDPLGTSLKFNYRPEVLTTTLAYQLNPQMSIGVAANVYFSWLDVTGLEGIVSDDLSDDTSRVTNQGSDYAMGVGVTVGWAGRLFCDTVEAGFSWSPKVHMADYKQYRGLLASGSLDIPETYRAGLSTSYCNNRYAVDGEYRRYSRISSWANYFPGTSGGAFSPLFGTPNGPGFGWSDQWIVRAGVERIFTRWLVGRLGYRWEQSPIRKNGGTDTALNVLTLNNVVEQYATLGFTVRPDQRSEFSGFFEYGFFNRIRSQYPAIGTAPDFVAASLRFKSYNAKAGVAYGLKY